MLAAATMSAAADSVSKHAWSEISRMWDRFDGLDQSVERSRRETACRFDIVEKMLWNQEDRLGRVERVQTEHTKHFERIDAVQVEHSERLDRIETVLAEHTKVLESHTAQLAELSVRMDVLEEAVRIGFEHMMAAFVRIEKRLEVLG